MSKSTIRNFIVATLAIVFAIGAFGAIMFGINVKEKTLKEQLVSLETQNQRETAFYNLQKTAEESQSDRAALKSNFLQNSGDSISVLNLIETLAPQNGVTLVTEGLEEGKDKKTKQAWIDASFSFSGTRSDVERFVQILEALPYLTEITQIDLGARALDNWEARVTMRVFILNHDA